jgi:D-arabinose 1-dehydrogenase-like Zn-dependent alcohol dehydrogenase
MPLARLSGKHAAAIMVAARRTEMEELATFVGDGLKVPIDSTFPVRDVGKALARLAKGGMKGRVVITVEDGF